MTYFVTGATGFIGRHLVERLLANREGDIHVLVREGSVDKLNALMEGWAAFGDTSRIKPVFGDLGEPTLGVDDDAKQALKGNVDHFFHLAAIYDMTADEERNMALNVGGTQNAVDLANELEAGIVHHVSSIAAAGLYKGHFTEDMFDEGQKLAHPYHRTKFESERIARNAHARAPGASTARRSSSATRRPARWTRSTARTTSSRRSRRSATRSRSGCRCVGIEVGWTNIVPVDYVAGAMDHIAHQAGPRRPGLPPRRPQGHARRRRDEHVRPAPRTRRRWRCASTSA